MFLAVLALVFLSSNSTNSESEKIAAALRRWIPESDFAALEPRFQTLLRTFAERHVRRETPIAACFANSVPLSLVQALEAALRDNQDFQLVNRWSTTATNGGGLGQGAPTTITYSFVPDGTPINGGVGEPAAPSNLFAAFNAAFPSQATWQTQIQNSFTDWGNLTGITYVFEPNDDGVTLGSLAGVVGVRGDVRIGGHFIDGGSNILAYNSFPNNGDMVLDTGDTAFYSNAGTTYLRLRNTIRHEHGHGLGMAHSCPINNTKLMEPFLSTAFNGPQFDDIAGAQRFYGDNLEPNDTTGTASDLGSLNNGTTTRSTVSVDDNSDVDFYQFTITTPKRVTTSVTPAGASYLSGPQLANGSCDPGTAFDPRIQNDLGIEVRSTNGTTVLGTANANPAGQAETLVDINLPAAGTYFIRVFAGASDTAQMYDLSVTINDPNPFSYSFPNGIPTTIPSNTTSTVDVLATPGSSTANPATGLVFTSIGAAPFTSAPLASLGGNLFRATLPAAPCFATVRWYVSMAAVSGGLPLLSPATAPTTPYSALSTSGVLSTVFYDNFQTDLGWTVTNNAALTAGAWQRAVPNGGGARGDPPTDGDGSGQCYVTQNGPGDTDVDGGTTTLTSPIFNLLGVTDALVVVRFWYDNVAGGNPGTDTFPIQISNNNGATWVTMETYNASVDAWVERQYRVGQFVAPSAQVRIRFTAQDPAPGAVVEAGVDAVRVLVCQNNNALGACAAGTYPIGQTPSPLLRINGSSGGTTGRVDVAAGAAIGISMAQPVTNPGPAGFLLFGLIGVPGPLDATAVPPLGTMCFMPCGLGPVNPALFMLADTFNTGLCTTTVLAATPTPWSISLPGFPFPIQFTLQGVIAATPTAFALTNAVIVNITL